MRTYLYKAIGSGKAGKALALPLFPYQNYFYINACAPIEEQIDALLGTRANIRTYALMASRMALFKEGDGPHQPSNFRLPKRYFGKKSIINRSFQRGWFKR